MPVTSPEAPETEPLRLFVAAAVGAGCRIADRSRSFGRRSITWHVTAACGTRFYLKRHEHRKHFATELLALRQWVPRLPADGRWTAPRVEASDDALGAMLLTELPGEPLSHAALTADERREILARAGSLAARVHALAVDPGPAGPARLYDRAMLDVALAMAKPHLDDATLRRIEDACGIADAFSGLAVVPTHGDFGPRNWLVHRRPDGLSLGVIDWERARAGFWLEDVRAVSEGATKASDRTAFFAGYGRRPTEREERQIALVLLMNATATLGWAVEHEDVAFAEHGRRTIARLLANA